VLPALALPCVLSALPLLWLLLLLLFSFVLLLWLCVVGVVVVVGGGVVVVVVVVVVVAVVAVVCVCRPSWPCMHCGLQCHYMYVRVTHVRRMIVIIVSVLVSLVAALFL
jgi:hypothetical protein